MRELDVLGVRVEMPTNSPIVLLREREGQRYVPIWIGAPEATAIAYAQQGVEAPRPLTHDLMVTLVRELGHRLTAVHLTELRDNTFYAELHIDEGTVISARPSDAIALALRAATPIFATEALLDEVGITMAVEEEDEVERFREFLDTVSAEDFEGPGEAPGPGAGG
ncbi:bifunctional nuclease family protein [Ornithinimicrobium avium]|uniref:Bifunctional nuclease family protein n=1 Tax=Ornithinimicrobium avium TaxID=2283195 RepID=A0A345NJQ4_9MICO|nr:bifunctional nuclease family protein [Ornithinimicrobium avium]AXH95262.1 bifunctional nuclease family protein [Ornithinimicrobium avium]